MSPFLLSCPVIDISEQSSDFVFLFFFQFFVLLSFPGTENSNGRRQEIPTKGSVEMKSVEIVAYLLPARVAGLEVGPTWNSNHLS